MFYCFVLLSVESSLAPLVASAETKSSLKEADIKPCEKGENLNDFYHSKFVTSQCHFEYYSNITWYLSFVGICWLQTQIKTILENYVHCNTQSFCVGGDTEDPGKRPWDFSKEFLWQYFSDHKLLTTYCPNHQLSLLIFFRL